MEFVRVRAPEGGPWLEKRLMGYGEINGRFFVDVDNGSGRMPLRVFAELVHPDDLKYLQEKREQDKKGGGMKN
jgi:hypothetical protein